MNSTAPDPSVTEPSCLRQLAELERELGIATDAIARNCLSDFEQSLWRQEMLCAGVKRALHSLRAPQPKTQAHALQTRAQSLRTANQAYAVLIARSQASAALLQGLCSLYRHSRVSASGPQRIFSCEA